MEGGRKGIVFFFCLFFGCCFFSYATIPVDLNYKLSMLRNVPSLLEAGAELIAHECKIRCSWCYGGAGGFSGREVAVVRLNRLGYRRLLGQVVPN